MFGTKEMVIINIRVVVLSSMDNNFENGLEILDSNSRSLVCISEISWLSEKSWLCGG